MKDLFTSHDKQTQKKATSKNKRSQMTPTWKFAQKSANKDNMLQKAGKGLRGNILHFCLLWILRQHDVFLSFMFLSWKASSIRRTHHRHVSSTGEANWAALVFFSQSNFVYFFELSPNWRCSKGFSFIFSSAQNRNLTEWFCLKTEIECLGHFQDRKT